MRFPQNTTLKDIAQIIQATLVGDAAHVVSGMNEFHSLTPGDLVFVDHPKYYNKVLNSIAGVVLINKKVPCPAGKALLISEDPFRDFNVLTKHFNPFQSSKNAISESAQIGENTIIQPNCFIGNNVKIGKNCIIHANVSIYDNTIIGDYVTINSGSVLASNAFYYKKRDTGYDQLISGGRLIIKDHVHIGASCTIDRGVSGDTLIDNGTKLDNQVQIGHDTQIGKDCLIVSQVGIAGCVVIKDNVTIWGQVGIISGITIGENVTILAQSGISSSLAPNKQYFGSPATEYFTKLREIAAVKNLPDFLKSTTN